MRNMNFTHIFVNLCLNMGRPCLGHLKIIFYRIFWGAVLTPGRAKIGTGCLEVWLSYRHNTHAGK